MRLCALRQRRSDARCTQRSAARYRPTTAFAAVRRFGAVRRCAPLCAAAAPMRAAATSCRRHHRPGGPLIIAS